ncbi:MAG TPA: choice-of-anchor P family protein, partial [Jatrophihabitantaceae bacterium]|nr:choice-of-anchor P family protein [Jatrophihabitantaceae bacterium]
VFDSQCYDNAAGFAPFPDPIGFLQPAPGSTAIPLEDGQSATGIDALLVREPPRIVMTGRAYALASKGLLKVNPVADTGTVEDTGTSTRNKCAVPLTVGLLLAARALCSNVTTVTDPVDGVTAGSSVANVDLGLTGLPAVQLRTVSASSGTGCGGSNGTTEIGFLKVGTRVLISNLVHPRPNTTINVLGIKLILNEQIHLPGGLTVNAVHLSVGSLENLVIGSATTAITGC